MTDTEKREMRMIFPGNDLVLSLRGSSVVKNDIFDVATDEIERLRAYAKNERDLGAANADEIERLRKLLVPFAEAADTLDKEQWGDGSIEGSCAYITAKDCRDARDALDV